MNPIPSPQHRADRAGFYLTSVSAAAVPVSVFVSQTLLWIAAALLLLRRRLRFPPVWIPIALWAALTCVSLLASDSPASGLPQLKKLLVFLMLAAVYSAFQSVEQIRRLLWAWFVLGSAGALWSFFQFYSKWVQASARGEDFYLAYVADRITGFMSHWMTFSGHMMIILLIAIAVFLWARPRPYLVLAVAGLTGSALVLAQTRGMWIAAAVSIAYLIAAWRPKLLLAVPLAIGAGLLVSPQEIRDRALSIYKPGRADSNQHRIVCWRTGWEIIKAYPLLGVGPQQVRDHFDRYVPADIPRPLPPGYYDHLHSIYIHYAAERGVPAMLALIWFIVQSLIHAARAIRRTSDPLKRAVLHATVAVAIGVLVSGVTELNLGDSEVLAMFLAVVACGYRASDENA